MWPVLGGRTTGSQYAYREGGSAGRLLADLDEFVTGNLRAGWTNYAVALDLGGTFDSASLVRLAKTLQEFAAPMIIRRLFGHPAVRFDANET